MDDIRKRIAEDLTTAVSRLRQPLGALALEERPWAIGDNCAFADEVDGIQAHESREIGLATRELLVDRVNLLSAALDRLNDGGYGVCVECSGSISPARLHVMPEVQTCVRCQDGIECLGRLLDRRQRRVFAVSNAGVMSAASYASVRVSHLPNEEDRALNR